MRSGVGNPQPRVPTEVAFKREVPLLRVRVGGVRVIPAPEIGHPERPEPRQERVWKSELRLPANERVVESPGIGGVDANERIRDGTKYRDRIDAVRAPNHRFVVGKRAPCKTEAGREVVLVGPA